MRNNEIGKKQEKYNNMFQRMENVPKGERYTLEKIDEMILPAIRVLNKKGYYTRSSCSGHFYKESWLNVQFDREIKPDDFKTLPKGFKGGISQLKDLRPITKEEAEDGFIMAFDDIEVYIIEPEALNQEPYARFADILSLNAELLKWAVSLPERKPQEEPAKVENCDL